MEEQVKIEQDLSEEQLQEIAGECATCEADLAALQVRQGLVSTFQSRAAAARKRGDLTTAAKNQNAASTLIRGNGRILETIVSRGH